MEKILRFVGTTIFTLCLLGQSITVTAMPILDRYYTRADGDFLANFMWSRSGHTGAQCSCYPDDDGLCEVVIPSNSVVFIKHNITCNCNITISNNATLIIDSLGTLNITGTSSLTGTGNLQINHGGTLNISGDFDLNGTGTGINNGVVNVYGDLTFSGNSSLCGTGVVNVGGSTIGGNPCSTIVLPIQLLSFEAEPKGNKVELRWSTGSEVNNNYFSIERSENGIDFTEIGRLFSAGNSNVTTNYMFNDETPLEGVSYYRLRQHDLNGVDKIYNPVSVIRKHDNGQLLVFPNPVYTGGKIYITFSNMDEGDLDIIVHDLYGRSVYAQIVSMKNGTNCISIDANSSIPPGTYYLTARSGEKIYNSKILVE